MNVDELRSVLRTERQKDSLQQLRESFYEDVAEFIAQQKAIRNQKAEELGTHYSPEIRRITDEIETAEEVVISIYERRVGKVVKAASFAAAGMSSSTEGLTHEEKRLFEDLVTRIEENRTTVLSTLEDVAADEAVKPDVMGDSVSTDEPATPSASSPYQSESEMATSSSTGPAIPPDEPDPEQVDAASSPSPTDDAGDVLADAMGGGADTSSDSTDAADGRDDETPPTDRSTDDARTVIGDDVADSPSPTSSADDAGSNPESDESDPLSGLADDRQTVRITADVGTIFGVDEREYELAREDVVTLPSANADPLVERGAAEKLE